MSLLRPRAHAPASALAVLVCASLASAQPAPAAAKTALPSIETKTAAMQKLDGFVPLYWDEAEGRLYLEIARFGVELLHSNGFAAGLGSNDIGIDRGALAGSRIVFFERVGPRVLMVQPNYDFRASSQNPDEVRAVRDAFARSVLWGFTVAAETGGRVLVDATEWLLRDNLDLAPRLRPGSYKLDEKRSSLYRPGILNFPKNTEIEVELTYVLQQPSGPPQGGAGPGAGLDYGGGRFFEGVPDVAASGEAASLRIHHSFVELPDSSYRPRASDPRAGFIAITYQERSARLDEPLERRLIVRHRLEKTDPGAKSSAVKKPIVYYLDPGTPEPERQALLEGAGWWSQAFEAAGFKDAFRVELRPPDVSPLDARYNVINWVHRSTRGWSTGGSIYDPRTGEIIKGVVTLGSLRVRQDYLIAEGLLAPYAKGDEKAKLVEEWALARLRQLAAHEVGHTLGLQHNYYDSELGRISVMDYPHPLVTLKPDGTLDASSVYARGIGEWDKTAIAWGYGAPGPGGDESRALARILDEAWTRDVRFMTNQDMEAHPRVDWWSNGTDAAAELQRMLAVRRAALARFGESAIRRGRPMATIEEALVPLYLHHRYQVEAAASVLGGQHYVYAMRGDGRQPTRAASAAEQQAALEALMRTLDPAELRLPDPVLAAIPPRPLGYGPHRELFPRYTGPTFDAVSPAVVAADLTLAQLLDPERAARLLEQKMLDSSLPGLDDVIDRLLATTRDQVRRSPYEAEIARAVERVVAERLMALAGGAGMPQVRALASEALRRMLRSAAPAAAAAPPDRLEAAHAALLEADIRRFLDRAAAPFAAPATPLAPPGPPIGEPALEYLRSLEPFCSQGGGG
jgi:hypothetical protein